MKLHLSSSRISFLLAFAFALLLLTPVLAQEPQGTGTSIYETAKNAATNAGFSPGNDMNERQLPVVIGLIIGSALLIVGSVFLAFMIYGGYLWLTAKGNTEQVNKARELIIDASIGILIVTSAYVITYFIVVMTGAVGYKLEG